MPIFIAAAMVMAAQGALADAGHGKKNAESTTDTKTAIGEFVAANKRVVEVVMTDNAFSLPRISVRPGEQVAFMIRNEGEFVHEFNIGTAAMHRGHEEEMAAMMQAGKMDMLHVEKPLSHAHDNSVLLNPGENAVLIWKFGTGGDVEFACNVPGHYQDGMRGSFRFDDAS